MKQFKYIFDPSSKKFRCPSCAKKTFVLYIDYESGQYLDDRYGRCDRENKCGYFCPPSGNQTLTSHDKLKEIVKRDPIRFDESVLDLTLNDIDNNPFLQFIDRHFGPEAVLMAIENYLIGTSKEFGGSTIFWQLDQNFQIRTGKIMAYNRETCKRIKSTYSSGFSWAHKKYKHMGEELQQCLFGLHRVEKITKKVCLVESEKTAVLGFLYNPQFVWLATGSSSNFSERFLNPIKDKQIIVFPDTDSYDNWYRKSIELNKNGYRISVLDTFQNYQLESGSDLADIIIRLTLESEQ